ncbi:MAG: hypothetical protein ACXWDO_04340 [Bacteroidia bacterium]
MKKNLLYGIIGGAAVGAAASYLMGAKDRKNFVTGIKNLSETVTDTVNGLMGSESTSNRASGSSTGRSTTGTKSAAKSSPSTSRRG